VETLHPLFRASRTVRSIFALRGVIDEAALPVLKRELRRFAGTTTGDVVIDCLDLVSIDASGAAVLLAFHNEMLGFGRRVSVRRIPARCRDTFESNDLGGLSSDLDPTRRALRR
jgi:anti-anti-sigma regulatory factor